MSSVRYVLYRSMKTRRSVHTTDTGKQNYKSMESSRSEHLPLLLLSDDRRERLRAIVDLKMFGSFFLHKRYPLSRGNLHQFNCDVIYHSLEKYRK